MIFKINEGLFKVDGFYYLTDPLRTIVDNRYHLVINSEGKIEIILLNQDSKFSPENKNLLNMGVIIASNKHLLNTPYLPLSIFLDDVKEVEIKTFGLGSRISPGGAYWMDTNYNKDGFEEVILLNYK